MARSWVGYAVIILKCFALIWIGQQMCHNWCKEDPCRPHCPYNAQNWNTSETSASQQRKLVAREVWRRMTPEGSPTFALMMTVWVNVFGDSINDQHHLAEFFRGIADVFTVGCACPLCPAVLSTDGCSDESCDYRLLLKCLESHPRVFTFLHSFAAKTDVNPQFSHEHHMWRKALGGFVAFPLAEVGGGVISLNAQAGNSSAQSAGVVGGGLISASTQAGSSSAQSAGVVGGGLISASTQAGSSSAQSAGGVGGGSAGANKSMIRSLLGEFAKALETTFGQKIDALGQKIDELKHDFGPRIGACEEALASLIQGQASLAQGQARLTQGVGRVENKLVTIESKVDRMAEGLLEEMCFPLLQSLLKTVGTDMKGSEVKAMRKNEKISVVRLADPATGTEIDRTVEVMSGRIRVTSQGGDHKSLTTTTAGTCSFKCCSSDSCTFKFKAELSGDARTWNVTDLEKHNCVSKANGGKGRQKSHIVHLTNEQLVLVAHSKMNARQLHTFFTASAVDDDVPSFSMITRAVEQQRGCTLLRYLEGPARLRHVIDGFRNADPGGMWVYETVETYAPVKPVNFASAWWGWVNKLRRVEEDSDLHSKGVDFVENAIVEHANAVAEEDTTRVFDSTFIAREQQDAQAFTVAREIYAKELPPTFYRAFFTTSVQRELYLRTAKLTCSDGAHVICPTGGVILTLSTTDAAGNRVQLAWGFVSVENNWNWDWFLVLVELAFPGIKVDCSDKDKGRENAGVRLTTTVHTNCFQHIERNLKDVYTVSKAVWISGYRMANAASAEGYVHEFKQIFATNQDLANALHSQSDLFATYRRVTKDAELIQAVDEVVKALRKERIEQTDPARIEQNRQARLNATNLIRAATQPPQGDPHSHSFLATEHANANYCTTAPAAPASIGSAEAQPPTAMQVMKARQSKVGVMACFEKPEVLARRRNADIPSACPSDESDITTYGETSSNVAEQENWGIKFARSEPSDRCCTSMIQRTLTKIGKSAVLASRYDKGMVTEHARRLALNAYKAGGNKLTVTLKACTNSADGCVVLAFQVKKNTSIGPSQLVEFLFDKMPPIDDITGEQERKLLLFRCSCMMSCHTGHPCVDVSRVLDRVHLNNDLLTDNLTGGGKFEFHHKDNPLYFARHWHATTFIDQHKDLPSMGALLAECNNGVSELALPWNTIGCLPAKLSDQRDWRVRLERSQTLSKAFAVRHSVKRLLAPIILNYRVLSKACLILKHRTRMRSDAISLEGQPGGMDAQAKSLLKNEISDRRDVVAAIAVADKRLSNLLYELWEVTRQRDDVWESLREKVNGLFKLGTYMANDIDVWWLAANPLHSTLDGPQHVQHSQLFDLLKQIDKAEQTLFSRERSFGQVLYALSTAVDNLIDDTMQEKFAQDYKRQRQKDNRERFQPPDKAAEKINHIKCSLCLTPDHQARTCPNPSILAVAILLADGICVRGKKRNMTVDALAAWVGKVLDWRSLVHERDLAWNDSFGARGYSASEQPVRPELDDSGANAVDDTVDDDIVDDDSLYDLEEEENQARATEMRRLQRMYGPADNSDSGSGDGNGSTGGVGDNEVVHMDTSTQVLGSSSDSVLGKRRSSADYTGADKRVRGYHEECDDD